MVERTEKRRLDALRRLDLLDTGQNEAFDRVTRMAAKLYDMPIAAVSLTDSDRQWFKSRVGITHFSIPREKAPCAQVAETCGLLIIPDLLADAYYRDSYLAQTGVRFYAGAPLITRDGFGLGSMCVLDLEPRQTTNAEMASLVDLAAIVMAQIELQHAFGRVDPVSGLPNHMQFMEDLGDLARDHPAHERRLAVVVDLASPQQLNNALTVMGSSYIEDMVKAAASMIRDRIGPARKTYHVGATQFAFLAPAGVDEAGYIANVEKQLSEIRSAAFTRFVTTTTIGVAPFTLGDGAVPDVLRIAHSAAQHARSSNMKVGIYSSAQDALHQRSFALVNEFGRALERAEQLRLVYQPRIDLVSGACIGVEALLRWNHPSLGNISPGEIMPIIELTAMMKATTAWVVETALKQLAAWRRLGLDLIVSVNVSAANLLEQEFTQGVIESLARHGLSADLLELELTETAVMEDPGQALTMLGTMADAGIRLAIDDFGTGYSSLSYLSRLPVQVVKIDGSFMSNLDSDQSTRSLLLTMIALCHDLGYRVVAEGVETYETLSFIKQSGCDEAQGYLLGRPMEPRKFATWFHNWSGLPTHQVSAASLPE